jgi:hypothetical protein
MRFRMCKILHPEEGVVPIRQAGPTFDFKRLDGARLARSDANEPAAPSPRRGASA